MSQSEITLPSNPSQDGVTSADDRPLVSCIIIFLNEEAYLEEAIKSIFAQTFADWELLLVDDGSSDGSSSIARKFAAMEPDRVRYLTHGNRANLGMSASRNLGLRHARGRFVAFLDGDDVWYPNKLAKQTNLFAENPEAVMVCGATLYWHSWAADNTQSDMLVYTGDVLVSGRFEHGLDQDRIYQPGELTRRLYPLARGATPSSSGYMITRRLAIDLGGFEDEFRGIFEDQAFCAKAYLAGPIYISSDCFDCYRQHCRSSVQVARATGELKIARRHFFRWYKKFLRKIRSKDREITQLLNRSVRRFECPRLYRIIEAIRRRSPF